MYYSSFDFIQPLKNEKSPLNSQAIQKNLTGWIWPAGCSLLTSVID